MKYEETNKEGISRKTLHSLEQIAIGADSTLKERGGIECRGNDSEDFPEVSVCAIQRMLEEAYRLGRADGQRSVESAYKFLRRDVHILSGDPADGDAPIDRNDPDSAGDAIEFSVPTGFSWKAKDFMEYLEGSGFIFAYKGRLVLTDESLYLTEHGDGTIEAPFGGPRADFASWDTLEDWLENSYDELKAHEML